MVDFIRSDDTKERNIHRRLLANPDSWQYWPVCAVKRRNPDPNAKGLDVIQCGLVLAGTTTVYLHLIFDPSPVTFDTPRFAYPSLDDLLNDGWLVD